MDQQVADQEVQPAADRPQNVHVAMKSVPQQSGEPGVADAGNLEKIRDILFGPQMQDYHRRFMRLEERLLKEASELREEFRRRHDTLEAYMRKEMEALHERLRAEQNERGEATGRLAREIKESRETLEKKTAQVAEQMASGQRQLHQQLLDQSKSLADDLRLKSADILSLLERQMQEMRADKTDRSALAAMFTEMAMRLNDEWQFPSTDVERVP
jgi:DNA repair exonuclease SbcCD ATPase subunit